MNARNKQPFDAGRAAYLTLNGLLLAFLLAPIAIVIVATHDLDLADGLVTRVALIRDGKLIADEPAAPGLRSRYRTLLSAGNAS